MGTSIYGEKSASNGFVVTLYIICHFLFAAFKFCSLYLSFNSFTMMYLSTDFFGWFFLFRVPLAPYISKFLSFNTFRKIFTIISLIISFLICFLSVILVLKLHACLTILYNLTSPCGLIIFSIFFTFDDFHHLSESPLNLSFFLSF